MLFALKQPLHINLNHKGLKMLLGKSKIGFMQGRLSPDPENKIQFFPWDCWKDEFVIASENNLKIMEWTLDYHRLYENPLMSREGQEEIRRLQNKYSIEIPSLTGDCFMQMPFYKATRDRVNVLLKDFENIVEACGRMLIKYIVFPLVDNGSLQNSNQLEILYRELLQRKTLLDQYNVNIVFESDFLPNKLSEFIKAFPAERFGINYDVGNSASLGYNIEEEWNLYGNRIMNIHIKDRIYKGTTVPLGLGSVNFDCFLKTIKKFSYDGNMIFQAARSSDGDHLGAIINYKKFIKDKFESV